MYIYIYTYTNVRRYKVASYNTTQSPVKHKFEKVFAQN